MTSRSEQASSDPCHLPDGCDKNEKEIIPTVNNISRYKELEDQNDYQYKDVEYNDEYYNDSRELHEKYNLKTELQDYCDNGDTKEKKEAQSRERYHSNSKGSEESKSQEDRDLCHEPKEERNYMTKKYEWDRNDSRPNRWNSCEWKREVEWDKYKHGKRQCDRDRNKHYRFSEHEESKKARSKEREDSEWDRSYEYENVDYRIKLTRAQNFSDCVSCNAESDNSTIVIRYLMQDVTENDIQQEIIASGFIPIDVRLIKRRDTGESKGFAFVNFSTHEEACRWMRKKEGELILKNGYKALMHFSICRDSQIDRNLYKYSQDWYCIKCGIMNFKRRETCFRCHSSRKSCEDLGRNSEVSLQPTSTVLLRDLDVLSTENSVLQAIKTISSVPIKSIRIAQDPLTNVSRGICYLEMNHITDAISMYNSLIRNPLVIDGRMVLISYRKVVIQHTQTDVDSIQKQASTELTHYTLEDIPRLANYAASLYSTSSSEYVAYQQYYQQYYQAQILQGNASTQTDSVNAAAAVAQSAIQQLQATKHANVPVKLAEVITNSSDKDNSTSRYQYDETSGYYYDSHTGLYYDAGTKYYYNPQTQQYLYWNSDKEINQPVPIDATNKVEEKKDKEDKVKVAKKIAKDMKRWAKTLNQKKDNTRQNVPTVSSTPTSSKTVGAVDAGYAILERKNCDITKPSMSPLSLFSSYTSSQGLVPAYGSSSNSEDEIEDVVQEDKRHINWDKLACLLCKRQFATKESLTRHQQLSDLHKLNLETWYNVRGLNPNDPQQRNKKYRDRARERRQKFIESETPCPNKLKEKYLKTKEKLTSVSYEEPTKSGIGSDNIGNRLLQKMGWKEGMGLGKTNQGSTSVVKVEGRLTTMGLGAEGSYSAVVGDTYKDCVKKLMFARYQELSQKKTGEQCTC